MNRRLPAIAAVLLLTACSSPVGGSTVDDPPATATTAAEPEATATLDQQPVDPPTDEPSDSDEDPMDYQAKFGQTFQWEDGMKVLITARDSRKTDTYDDVAKDGNYVILTVKVTNGSSKVKTLDGSGWEVYYGKDGEVAPDAYVSSSNYNSYLDGKVSPHKSKTARSVYALTRKQAKDLTVQMTPTYEYDAVEYTGAATG